MVVSAIWVICTASIKVREVSPKPEYPVGECSWWIIPLEVGGASLACAVAKTLPQEAQNCAARFADPI